ncbi:hypothetical protein [Streptomyces sp. NPDC049813]|uniref:hypothetical protein n=1 Tax=Streptomyces sp. NPDC049813 TaxID=3365597 RepID=UPI0037A557DB
MLAAAVAVFASGCLGPVEVDPEDVPGTYRDSGTGGEIRLEVGGRFSVTGIAGSDLWWHGGAESVDIGGTWTAGGHADFVYLQPDPVGGDQGASDIQLYTASSTKVFLQPDPDGPITLDLVKVDSP